MKHVRPISVQTPAYAQNFLQTILTKAFNQFLAQLVNPLNWLQFLTILKDAGEQNGE